jgi:hypothetical protein
MTVYTYWGNRDERTNGTSVLNLVSGMLIIGHSADLTDAEVALLSQNYVLKPGNIPWTRTDFPWEIPDVAIARVSGGSGGGGAVYNYLGAVASASQLPTTGNRVNDAYLAIDTIIMYAWNGTQWVSSAIFSGQGIPSPVDGGLASTTAYSGVADGGDSTTISFSGGGVVDGGGSAGLPSILIGGDSTTSSFAATLNGGDSSTTTFTQTISGGTA